MKAMALRVAAALVLIVSYLEKSSPWLGSGTRCGSWGAGGRSSRKGQAGPVREDLHPVRGGFLLHPWH